MEKRGSRKARAERESRAAARARPRDDGGGSRFGLWVKRLVIWGLAVALLGALFLGIAVVFAARSPPSFYQLKATQAGQTIVVRARDGSEIAELGPNYGQWVPFARIPQVMKDAMIAVEDRRF